MKKIILFIIIIGVFTSCKDYLNVNTDPLAATEADANVIFPEVLVNLSNNRTIELSGLNMIAQTQASGGSAGVFLDPERYTLSTYTVGNTWSNYYVTGLKNLSLVIKDAEAKENLNTVAQAKILQAFIFYNATVIWEEIPFTEALDPATYQSPHSDSQETILNGIVDMIDDALALIGTDNGLSVVNGDLVYGGDMLKWEKFGNSLKYKALMLMANKVPGVGSQLETLNSQPLISGNDDEANLDYYDSPGNYNPQWNLYNLYSGGDNVWFFANNVILDLMVGDPRLGTYFSEALNDAPGVYTGQDAGVSSGGGTQDDLAWVSDNIIRPDAPDRYITAAEILLLQAEAAARGLTPGGMSEANDKLQEGVGIALDYYDGQSGEIDAVDKTTFLASLPDLTALTSSEAIRVIQEQQYIESFNRGTESWTQVRRTGVPTLPLPVQAVLGNLVRRFPYASDEVGANPNSPSQKPLDTPMWFEN